MLKKIFFFICTPLLLLAQELPIQPEETPYLLKPKQLQVETGFTFKKINHETQVIAAPNQLFKLGLTKWLELRLLYEYNFIKSDLSQTNRFLPFQFGFKNKLWKEQKWIPEAALVTQIGVPNWAHSQFKLENWLCENQIMLQGNYSKKYSINYNFGIKWDGVEAHPFYTYKWTHSYLLSKWLTAYTDLLGHVHTKTESHASADIGLMFQFTDNMMLDITGGVGLNEATPDYFTSLIFPIRI